MHIRALFVAAVSFASLGSAAAQETQERRELTVVLVGDAAHRADIERALRHSRVEGFEVHLLEAPTVTETPIDTRVEDAVAAARNLYVNEGDFGGCLSRLDDELVDQALGRGDALGASRVLLWRTACAVAAGDYPRAESAASQFASLGLQRPPEIEAVSPEVDQRLSAASEALRRQSPVELNVRASARGGVVLVDGRLRRALPATLRLPPGAHVLRVEAPGRVPQVRRVTLTEPQTLSFDLPTAPPELAARQWAERFASGSGALSQTSLSLMAQALSVPRLALVEAEETGDGIALRAALGVRSLRGASRGRVVVAARARTTLRGTDASALLRDLLVGAHLLEPAPPLRRRPLFWVAVGAAVVGSITLGVLLGRDPRHPTDVVIQ